MKLNKMLAIAMSSVLVFSALPFTSFADEVANGKYEMKVSMYKESADELSMSDPLFAEKADVEVKDGEATIKIYVGWPVPNFPTLGPNGTLTDFSMKYNGTDYSGDLDITTKPLKPMKTTNATFGTVAGEAITTEVITVKAPAGILQQEFIDTAAYVAVVMNSNVKFRTKVVELTKIGELDPSNPSDPSTKESKDVTIKATIAASQAAYSVVIPESINFGELNRNQDNNKNYDVQVTMGAGTTGRVKVSADATGKLLSGSEEIPFGNNFGSKEFTQTGTETGTLTVLKNDMQNKAPGEYKGTTSFSIEYTAQ